MSNIGSQEKRNVNGYISTENEFNISSHKNTLILVLDAFDSELMQDLIREYPEEVDDVVFNLDTDEVSTAIAADGGYYFFQCLDKYNEDLSEANKEVIIEKRRKQVLEDIISDLEERYFSDMNSKLWDQIDFPEDSSELTNASFFKTLNDNL